MKKLHEQSCYGCRFAIEARNHMRQGEQVRCKKAEELFGGERWVNVRKGKTGNVLKSKCGEFQPFQGDDSTAPEPPKEKKKCENCQGKGQIVMQFMSGRKYMQCKKCDGRGEVTVD